jgi:hypothetical protein
MCIFYFSRYDPFTVTHLFQRFSNKAMPSKKIPLLSSQKISLALLLGFHPKKNGVSSNGFLI